jgi:hypothetical protein
VGDLSRPRGESNISREPNFVGQRETRVTGEASTGETRITGETRLTRATNLTRATRLTTAIANNETRLALRIIAGEDRHANIERFFLLLIPIVFGALYNFYCKIRGRSVAPTNGLDKYLLMSGLLSVGKTPLRLAVENDNEYLVEALISQGVPVDDSLDHENCTVLDVALRKSSPGIIRTLLTKGATAEFLDGARAKSFRRPIATAVVSRYCKDSLQTIPLLLERGVDLNVPLRTSGDIYHFTTDDDLMYVSRVNEISILMHAILNNTDRVEASQVNEGLQIVRLLLQHSANPNYVTKFYAIGMLEIPPGQPLLIPSEPHAAELTPLSAALLVHNLVIAKALVRLDANPGRSLTKDLQKIYERLQEEVAEERREQVKLATEVLLATATKDQDGPVVVAKVVEEPPAAATGMFSSALVWLSRRRSAAPVPAPVVATIVPAQSLSGFAARPSAPEKHASKGNSFYPEVR